MENETQRLKVLDEHHNQLLKDWRAQLHPRKKVLALISNIEHKQILSGGPLGGHCLGLNNFFVFLVYMSIACLVYIKV